MKWTEGEKQFLKDNWLSLTATKIAEALTRLAGRTFTTKAVQRAGEDMGLPNKHFKWKPSI